MCRIYDNSYVTLCASSTMSCHESFLQPRGPRCRIPFLSNRLTGLQEDYDLRAVFCGQDRSWDIEDWDLSKNPWSRRGWVFQERLSAPRKLIFGSSSLFFECDGENVRFGGHSVPEPLFRSISHMVSGKPGEDQLAAWFELTCNASATSLTRATDRLPALSGLAHSFSRLLPGKYYAGHWDHDLHIGLTWFIYFASCRPLRATFFAAREHMESEYTVPSWSLLSASVRFSASMHKAWHARLFMSLGREAQIRPEIEMAGSNPFGAIRVGTLHITTLVLDLSHPALSELCVYDPKMGSKRDMLRFPEFGRSGSEERQQGYLPYRPGFWLHFARRRLWRRRARQGR